MRIILVSGFNVTVDDADAGFLERWAWNIQTTVSGLQYVRRTEGNRTTYLHRVIMKAPGNMVVDHIDGDGLNNQRSNLRVVTQRQNTWNRRGVAGVSWSQSRARWRASIRHRGRKYEIGFYELPEEALAARAYVASVLRRGFAPAAEIGDPLILRPTIRRLLHEVHHAMT